MSQASGERIVGSGGPQARLLDVRNWFEDGGQLCPCVNPEGTEMGCVGQATSTCLGSGLWVQPPADIFVRFFLLL